MASSQLEWLTYANAPSLKQGMISTVDNNNQPLILEWNRADILSLDLAAFKKDLSGLAAEKLSKSELAFLIAHPESAASEMFLFACKPLLNNGIENADLNDLQETIKTSIKQFYLADLSKFGPDLIKPLLNDLFFCATLRKPHDKDPQGFLLFSVTPALPFGDVKVINFFMKDGSSLNLHTLLMELIFKILPPAKRLFLFARPTDLTTIETYSAMGFEKDKNPFQDPNHKINHEYQISLEYRVEHSKKLFK